MILPPLLRAGTGRRLILVALLPLCACAGGPPGTPLTRYDGIYAGTLAPNPSEPGCTASRHGVRFHVAGYHIWVHSHHQSRRLDGTVENDGQFALQDENARRRLSGTIVGDRLTGLEMIPRPGRHETLASSACTLQVDAMRRPTGVAVEPSDEAD